MKKKKVILLTSKGGYGHMAACNAINNFLNEYYDIKIVNPFETVFGKLDFIKSISGGRYDGEKAYNLFLRKGWFGITNFCCRSIAPSLITQRRKSMRKLMNNFLKIEKPDLLVSVIPYLNYPINQATTDNKIPFLLVTTDSDIENWLHNLNRLKKRNFDVTVGFDVPQSTTRLRRLNFEKQNVHITGFPIRADFLEKKNIEKLKQQWEIPKDKFTILLMMGGAGGRKTMKYVKSLLKSNHKVHALVCVGRNIELGKKITNLATKQPSKTVSFKVIPFTKRISDLMACSDLLITKPGPGSVNEALHMKLPIVLDKIGTTLYWERANIDYVLNNNFGDAISRISDLEIIIDRYITNQDYYQNIKHQLANFKKPHFEKNIKKIIFNLCPPASLQKIDKA